MLFLKILLLVVEVVCSLLLVAVILLQRSKGEGLGMAFGAEVGESLFGTRAANVLVKITIWLGLIFMLNTVFLAKIYSSAQSGSLLNKLAAPAPVPVAAPQTPAPAPAQPAPSPAPAGAPQPVPAPVN